MTGICFWYQSSFCPSCGSVMILREVEIFWVLNSISTKSIFKLKLIKLLMRCALVFQHFFHCRDDKLQQHWPQLQQSSNFKTQKHFCGFVQKAEELSQVQEGSWAAEQSCGGRYKERQRRRVKGAVQRERRQSVLSQQTGRWWLIL